MTPLQTGLALLPLGGAVALLAPVSGRLTAHVPRRLLIAGGLLCAAVGTFGLSRIGGEDGAGALWLSLLVLGAGAGFALPPTTATAVSAAPRARTGMASAIHNAGRQVGATLGVAALGSIVIAHAADGGPAAYAEGLSVALLVGAAALVVAALVALKALPKTG